MVRYVAGMPGDWDALGRAQAAGEFIWSGSCCVHPDDPKGACVPCHRAELEKRMADLGFDWKPGFAGPGVRFVLVDRANESARSMTPERFCWRWAQRMRRD